jgi:ferredoxin
MHRPEGQLVRRGLPRRLHPPDAPDYESVEQLYIDPDECIDCDACVEACPVDACFAEDQLPAEWAKYAEINANYYKKAA